MISGMSARISSPVLIGRGQDLERLQGAFDRSRSGEARCVAIGGEAGVGKTRLVDAFGELVEAQAGRVLTGGCIELGDDGLPLAPFINAMRDLEPAVVAAATDPDGLGIEPLFPGRGLLGRANDLEPVTAAQGRLFEGVLRLLGRLGADRPTVLVLEDLHWSDRSTRDLVRYLARYLRRERVVLILTYRSDELHRRHPLLPLLAELGRLPAVERILLDPLDRQETEALLGNLIDSSVDRSTADRLYARSDGNPFFVEELVAGGALTGTALPNTFRDIVSARFSTLPEETRAILRVAAAIGRRSDHELLAALAQVDDDDVVRRLRPAIDEHIIVGIEDPIGAAYEFRHALVAEALYDELLPAERTILHGQLAERLEERAAAGHRRRPSQAEIAYHWYRAHAPARAIAASALAADEAARMVAFPEVHAHLSRVLELWPAVPDGEAIVGMDRAAIAERAAEAAAAVGDHGSAIALGRDALARLWSQGLVDRWLWVSHRVAWYQFDSGDLVGAQSTVTASARVARDANVTAQARALTDEAQVHWSSGHFREQLAAAERAVALAQTAGDRIAGLHARMMVETARISTDDVEAGVTGLEHLLVDLSDGPEDLRAFTAIELTHGLNIGGWYDRSVDVGYRELAWLRARGLFPRFSPYVATNLTDALIVIGRWPEAWAQIEAPDWPREGSRASAWMFESEAELASLQGDPERADRAINAARQRVSERDAPVDHTWLHRAEGIVALAEGRLADASRAFWAAIGRSADPGADHPIVYWVVGFAIGCEASIAATARANRDGPAEREAIKRGRHLLEMVERSSSSRSGDTPANSFQAALRQAEGGRLGGEDDADSWASVAAEAGAHGWDHDEALARYRQAEATLIRGQDRSAAEDALRRAATLSTRLGAHPLEALVRDLATRARIDVAPEPPDPATPRQPLAEPYGLTHREREVLALVSAGRTNREIGEVLFISEKTASVHVTHILDKLGVSSRVEAALLASRSGGHEPSDPSSDRRSGWSR